MCSTEKKASRKRYDFILVAALLLLSGILFLVLVGGRKEGSVAVVEIGGERVAEYTLSQDGEYTLNGGTNRLVIKNGEAYMEYAECPDHTCIRTGRIRYAGERIVCLPNRVAVVIEGGEGVDVVS